MSKPINPAIQSDNSLANGLLRCITFTEGSGSTLTDYSTLVANLTTRASFATSPATWGIDSTQGNYISFNGTTQDAVGTDTGLPTGTAARTFAFLFRTTVTTFQFFSGYGTSGDSFLGFGLGSPDGKNQPINSLDMTTLVHGSSGRISFADGQWHLGHCVLDASSNLTLYVDGQSIPVGSDGVNSSATVPFSPIATALGGNFFLGQLGSTGGSNPDGSYGSNYGGDMAGVWAWNRALSPADINNHYSDPWQMVRPAAAPPGVTNISVAPSNQTITGATEQFIATVTATGGAAQTVTWSRSPAIGSIDADGLFTTPAQTNAVQTVTITATSTFDTSKFGSTTATIPALVPQSATTTIAVSDSNRHFAPAAFYFDAGTAATSVFGYEKTAVTGTATIALAVDTSAQAAASLPATSYPVIAWSISGGAVQTQQLSPGQTSVTLATRLTTSVTYGVEWWVQSLTSFADTYTFFAVKVGDLILNSGGATVAPALRPKVLISIGDSISIGQAAIAAVSTAANEHQGENSRACYVAAVAQGLAAEFGQLGWSGNGFETNLATNAWPPIPTAFGLHNAGKSRLVSGKFSPLPDYVLSEAGHNGNTTAADVSAYLAALRAASATSTLIVQVLPFSRANAAAITAGFAAYNGTVNTVPDGASAVSVGTTDPRTVLVDLGPLPALGDVGHASAQSFDGTHPDGATSLALGAPIISAIRAAERLLTTPSSSTPSASDIAQAVLAAAELTPIKANVTALNSSNAAATQLVTQLNTPAATEISNLAAQTAEAVGNLTTADAAPGTLLAAVDTAGTAALPASVAIDLAAIKTKVAQILLDPLTGGMYIAPAGMELVMVEPGINARQALSPILAASAGAITGAGATSGTGGVQVSSPQVGSSAPVVRITGSLNNGTRATTTLNLAPALPVPTPS